MTVAAILKHKAETSSDRHDGRVASVGPADTIAAVTLCLAEWKIGAVLVQDSTGRLMGILSERDIIRSLATHGTKTLVMTAAQLMTTNLRTATPATTVTEAMEMMTAGRFRHLPVLENDCLAGIISIGDVVNARLRDQAYEVDSLKAYVAG